MERWLGLLERVCGEYGFKSCGRLGELAGGGGRLPPDLFLAALVGVVEEMLGEARARGLTEAVALLDEVKRDLEWVLREVVE
ncbi:hypothetical protein [Stetteria hydrogenophila]